MAGPIVEPVFCWALFRWLIRQTTDLRRSVIGSNTPAKFKHFSRQLACTHAMPRYYQKVIRIRAEDSPNVKLALAQIAAGVTPSNEELVPGVLSYRLYRTRRDTWDKVRQCVGLDGMFYQGAEVLLYPVDWLNIAETLADALRGYKRQAIAMGCDPAEGGDKSSWSIVDAYGLVKQVSMKTPDTTDVTAITLALMREHNIAADRVFFDRGGGGKEHADRLRLQGYPCRTIPFGEAVSFEPKRGIRQHGEKVEQREDRYAYLNRRAQMYHELRLLLDPSGAGGESLGHTPIYKGSRWRGFALPSIYQELRRQMAPIPLTHDPEGRVKILPKHKKADNSKEKTLFELLGCSPDELDSLVLAVYGLLHAHEGRQVAGAAC